MVVITTSDIVADPQGFVSRMVARETISVSHGSGEIAQVMPSVAPEKKRRTPGLGKGLVTVPADIMDPLPEDMFHVLGGK